MAKKYLQLIFLFSGSKNLRADLELLKQNGGGKDISKHLRYGCKILGICGGYQMLGRTFHDPTGVEGTIGTSEGLRYLPINTTLKIEKQLTHSQGKLLLQANAHDNNIEVFVSGYQIHVRDSEREDDFKAFALLSDARQDATKLNDAQLNNGWVSADNQVAGSYLHGMFDTPEALQQIIAWASADVDDAETYASQQEHELDRLTDACRLAESTYIYN